MTSRCPRPRTGWAGTAVILAAGLLLAATAAPAQFEPANGMRPTDLRTHAIVGATVIPAPGQRLERATIVMRGGVITAVGTEVEVPPETRRWSGEGLTVYPGLIDAALMTEASSPPAEATARHPNPKIRPEIRMASQTPPSASVRKSLRELGFTVAAVYPAGGIFRGQGTVIALADEAEHVLTYTDPVAQAIAFERSGWGQATKPSSLMGSIAVVRQTLLDAQWYAAAGAVYENHPEGNEPPVPAEALAALVDVLVGRQPVLFDVDNELDAFRACRIAEEFGLDPWLLGSGLEFRRLREIVELGVPMIIPLSFPDRPDVSRLPESDAVTLRTLQTWEQAPTNPRRLIDAGARIALTTHRLDKRSDFPARMQSAMKHGLDPDAALTALTVTPARLLGLDAVMGTIEPGKLANLVVVDGELFAKKAKLRDLWINGRRHEITPAPDPVQAFVGVLRADDGREIAVDLDTGKPALHVGSGEAKVKAKKVAVLKDRLTAVVDGGPFETEGYVRLAAAISPGEVTGTLALPDGTRVPFSIRAETPVATVAVEDDAPAPASGGDAIGRWEGDLEADEESRPFRLDLERDETGAVTGRFEAGDIVGAVAGIESDATTGVISVAIEADEEITLEVTRDESGLSGQVRLGQTEYTLTGRRVAEAPAQVTQGSRDDKNFQMPPDVLPMPLGAYGRTSTPEAETVLVRGATIWTAGPRGIIADGDLLIEAGRVVAIGSVPSPPAGARIIDATGKHVTPGLLDCHSHTGISGGVNEYPEANTAEVRIGDVIDPDDINWYRQLAGGLTAANQLHGSANPIGGQNSVVKLKWGGTVDDLRLEDAKGGIKFALGENVKRRSGRYPDTRMGVESFIRDAFVAAREYEEAHRRYRLSPTEEREKTLPPRRDLELDALVEIMSGDRLVHCHSYRQDEILMLIRVAETFGFTIGTFQHVLEGYKVAEAIAAHGAGASSFSDWWAYKVEVMDAIPHNGTLMTDVGVLVSFNSDSSELARRMNTEAAKAVRYGGLDPHEALKLVTVNPARQLGIDDRVGSLEKGKDADFVIWSADPLSTYARCEQTWIEGACYFDLESDQRMREQVQAERERLIQKALTQAHGEAPSVAEEQGDDDAKPAGEFAGLTDAQRAWMLEAVRLGRDPFEVRPGECGCGGVHELAE